MLTWGNTTAHIAELHWRIWGPILYERPMEVVARALGSSPLVEEDTVGEGSSFAGSADMSGESSSDTESG